jgi:ketosteroid isomerase-like protein
VKSTIVTLLAMGLLAGTALGQSSKRPAAETKLIALENAWNQAQLNHDSKALDTLVADTFVYTDYDGTVMDKARFLQDIKDPDFHPNLIANDGVKVHLYSGAAVVFGTYHAKGTYKGKSFDHYGRFTDTWIQQGDRWQCVASHTNLTRK